MTLLVANKCAYIFHQRSRTSPASAYRLNVRTRVVAGPEPSTWSGESFYSILGVSPVADSKTIKTAYYNLMREYHPDQAAAAASSSGSNGSIDTNEFCALLNDIYKTLSNVEARALYDSIAGFSACAINPFKDASYPADQVFVDEVSCIGCGKCVRACSSAFFIEGSTYGRARVVEGADVATLEEEIQVAIETCPVDCIHWVSSPQLSLLETTLAGMSRVDAFIMMRQSRSPGNVFEEANRAWNKRQANIAAMRRQHEAAAAAANSSQAAAAANSSWNTFWSRYVDFQQPTDGPFAAGGTGQYSSDDGALREPGARKVADLAAAAARAMRRWQVYHRVTTAQKALTE
eukprot:gene1837-2169_t